VLTQSGSSRERLVPVFRKERHRAVIVGGDAAVMTIRTPGGLARTALPDLGLAPELVGITDWINAQPTSLAALRGSPVLVHFWTFGCINCVHVQPHVKSWYERYRDRGLAILGVHTPELPFERDIDNVRAAVARAGITYPVAFDPDFATFDAYRNRYWPAFYFVDPAGHIRHTHFGEGDYGRSELVIEALLAETGATGAT
jgi:thiol-disulfide isomerase/thioredoxin